MTKHVKVESSNIHSVGYDTQAHTLEVVFKSSIDTVYCYENVSAVTFAKLLNAESHGKFFTKNIKPRFKNFTKSINSKGDK